MEHKPLNTAPSLAEPGQAPRRPYIAPKYHQPHVLFREEQRSARRGLSSAGCLFDPVLQKVHGLALR